jgi:putative GTP pyrophosphokinase
LISKLFAIKIEHCENASANEVSQIRDEIIHLERHNNIIDRLRALNVATEHFNGAKHVILEIDNSTRLLKIHRSRTLRDATDTLLRIEKSRDLFHDIVLVSADSSNSLRSAFRNYFSDTRDFIKYYDEAMKN